MNARLRGRVGLCFIVSALIFFFSAAARAEDSDPGGCSGCHDKGKKLAASVHSGVACLSCHPKHDQYPHPAGIPKPACAKCHTDVASDYARGVHGAAARHGNSAAPDCGVCHGDIHEVVNPQSAEFHKGVPDLCGMCHSEIAEKYKSSVHGKAVAAGSIDAPVCTNCHGEHYIIPPENATSPVNALNIRDTCARCHNNVQLARRYHLPLDRITSFDQSYHGLAEQAGSETVANCASCHGVHDILPSSDPKSTINPKNLPHTCGKCHPGAGTRFAIGRIHFVEGAAEPPALNFVRLFYLTLIPATLGLMFLHHFGDFARKLYRLRLRPPRPAYVAAMPPLPSRLGHEMRMYRWERIEHALLVISFSVLVWTGFALKYPDGWWARPLLYWESSWPVRGTIHRAAAGILLAVAISHIISLISSRTLHEHWRDLWPRKEDLYEAMGVFLYNFGLRATAPVLSAHSYVEKAEYWAVVWGTFIMGLSGVILWANKYTLAWFPKEWLDVATSVHFYEAVLATLAILIWHFYTVIFDPDVYPLDAAWLTGFSVRRREPHPPVAKKSASDESTGTHDSSKPTE